MSTVADGKRLIHEFDIKYEAGIIERELWIKQIEEGLRLISLEDMKQAKRIAKARGLDIPEE